MRKTLYLKFVLGYLIFGFFGFLVVATFVSSMTLEHLKREKADSLYKEATLIANTYASDLYSSNVSLEEVKKQLERGASPLEAALASGFADQSHLSKVFKRLIGLTPGQYRAIFRQPGEARHEG